MKAVILSLVLISGSIAQNYFPSEIGTKYQDAYSFYLTGPGGYSISKWTDHIITSDSIINGKRFVRFSQTGYGPFNSQYLYHFDQSAQKLFMKIHGDTTIRLAVDFNTAPGDSFISYLWQNQPRYFKSEGISFYQGYYPFKIRLYYRPDHHSYYIEYYFLEDVGLFLKNEKDINWASQTESNEQYKVRSAILDTAVWNPITLYLTSLSPLSNRPVTSFPFIMTGDYFTDLNPVGSNYGQLVDSFYVKIIQLRGADTVGTYKYPFNTSKLAFINLTPEVWDKLLVRAYVSDLSIFRNVDVYPDSGYAEILVLPPLPVELTSFTGSADNAEVVLNWSTASETNNHGFQVERKSGDYWVTAGFVKGSGTSAEINNYTFTEEILHLNKVKSIFYRLKQIDYNGSFEYSSTVEVDVLIADYSLEQNYPNPFNPETNIRYSIPERSMVTLKVYDILGNEVLLLVNEVQDEGAHNYNFNASGLPSGIYFYKLISSPGTLSRKMLLMK